MQGSDRVGGFLAIGLVIAYLLFIFGLVALRIHRAA